MTTSLTDDTRQLAETYDRMSDSQLESGKRLVERLGVAAGDRVLDVGCGTGRLARWIAERVGPKGSVVGIDPLPDRVAIARAHGDGITFEVGQAEDLGAFGEGSFDVVCLSAVFHWIEDKPKALRENPSRAASGRQDGSDHHAPRAARRRHGGEGLRSRHRPLSLRREGGICR